MTPRDEQEIATVLAIARRAAAIVMQVYAGPFEVELKGPDDPVTRADREANDRVCRELAEAFPGAAILAEESVPADPAAIADLMRGNDVFFVDPLDGTREFAARNDEFAVMIGRAREGRAELGVVVAPVSGLAFVGRVGARPDRWGPRVAFVEEASGVRRAPSLSSVSRGDRATLVVSRSHRTQVVDTVRDRLGIPREIACGSVGLKVGRILSGEADVYVHGGAGAKLWDSCAPEAILEAAGGRFTDLDGAAIDYRSGPLGLVRGIAATNGPLHAEVLAATGASR